jgi:hypothetical protein
MRYEQLELQGRRGRRSVCPSSTVHIQRKKCGYLHKLPNHSGLQTANLVCHCDASTATALHFGDNGGNEGQSITQKKHGSSNRKEPEICTDWTREEASRQNSLPLPLPLLVFFSLPLSQSKEKFVGFLQQPSPSHSITRTSQLSEKTRSSSLSGSFQFHPQRWRRQCAPITLSLHSIWNPRSLCQSPFLLSVTASSFFACDHVDIKSGFPSISELQ